MPLIVGLLIAAASPAAASPPASNAAVADIPQISTSRAPLPEAPPTARSVEAPPQLTREQRGAAGSAQLSPGPRSVAPSPQLAIGKPSAQGSAPLSSVRDGRTAAVQRVEGEDRCDPETGKIDKAECKRVIENRASEFRRREAPTLSPEERILVADQALERLGVEAATRRLALTGEDDSSIEAQGVAAIVLRQPQREETVEEKPSSEAEAAAALVGAILNPGPQP